MPPKSRRPRANSEGNINPPRRSSRLTNKTTKAAPAIPSAQPSGSRLPTTPPPSLDPDNLSDGSLPPPSPTETSPPPVPTTPTDQQPPKARPHTPRAVKTVTAANTDQPVMDSQAPTSGHANVDALTEQVEIELGTKTEYNGGTAFTERAFTNLVTPKAITKFLQVCKLYDSKKRVWKHIPIGIQDEKSLYTPITAILTSILSYFRRTDRQAVLTFNRKIPHHTEDGNRVLSTAPDLMIMGRGGRFFKHDQFQAKPRYADCASPFEVKTGHNYNFKKNKIQVAVYARECFITQHNRFKVYTAIMTETFLILFQFDRGGYMYSSRIDIHKDAAIFVRIILGLASDGEDLGFDPSIYWKDGLRYIDTVDNLGNPITCRIKGAKPSYFRNSIIGRASCCWTVEYKGTLYVVKEVWRSPNRTAEHEFLHAARDCAGVVKMYSHETKEISIAELRGLVGRYHDPNLNLKDRKWSRVMLIYFTGKRLDQFTSDVGLLEAAFDIACGHRNLWLIHILHRDFSLGNLLGGGTEAGFHGIILDLDMAIWTNLPEEVDDFRTGTRLFQSTSVLRGYPKPGETLEKAREKAHPHDYLDDLESLFYILAWNVFNFLEPGKAREERPRFLAGWDTNNPETAVFAKESFALGPITRYPIAPYFHPIFSTLLENLRLMLEKVIIAKSAKIPSNPNKEVLQDRHPNAIRFYDKFINQIAIALHVCQNLDGHVPLGRVHSIMAPPPPSDRGSSAVNTPFTSPLQDKGKQREVQPEKDDSVPLPEPDTPFGGIFDFRTRPPVTPMRNTADYVPQTRSTGPDIETGTRKRTLEDHEDIGGSRTRTNSPHRFSKVRKQGEGTSASETITMTLRKAEHPRSLGPHSSVDFFLDDPSPVRHDGSNPSAHSSEESIARYLTDLPLEDL